MLEGVTCRIFGHLIKMAPGSLDWEVFQACANGRTQWELLGIFQEEVVRTNDI